MCSALRATSALRRMIADGIGQAARQYQQTLKPVRVFVEFPYQTTTGSWERTRHVVAKAEYIDGKENPRYVVTSLAAESWPAQRLYEERYFARGDMENRIKDNLRCSPIAPAPRRCGPTNCGCICRGWRMRWCAACGAWD